MTKFDSQKKKVTLLNKLMMTKQQDKTNSQIKLEPENKI